MKSRPILFTAPMVRAILDGRKSQTRRVVKPQPKVVHAFYHNDCSIDTNLIFRRGDGRIHCPYGAPNDRLWVRENGWERPERSRKQMRNGADTWPRYIYDSTDISEMQWCKEMGWKRRPSIHMPRWASRITLEVTAVRVERLHDISVGDCIAEGCATTLREHDACCALEDQYRELWESINGPGSWDLNRWVWVVEFRRVET